MRVAAKANRLSRKMLLEQCTELFTADTVMRWYQRLIAEKYDGSKNREYMGRPPISQEVIDLLIRFAEVLPQIGCLSRRGLKLTGEIVMVRVRLCCPRSINSRHSICKPSHMPLKIYTETNRISSLVKDLHLGEFLHPTGMQPYTCCNPSRGRHTILIIVSEPSGGMVDAGDLSPLSILDM
jgi:hypothetical protein